MTQGSYTLIQGFSSFTKHQNHLQGLWKHIAGFPFLVSDPVCLGLNLKICISDSFPGTDAAGLGTTLWEALLKPNPAKEKKTQEIHYLFLSFFHSFDTL